MTEAVEKYIKKLYQLEKKAICRFANLSIWRFGDLPIWRFVDEKIKKIKNTVLRRCCRLIKQCFFVLVMMKPSVNEGFNSF